MLSLIRVAKAHGGRSVLAGIDLNLAAGEYVAVIGESGVGKSTLLNLVAGLEPADDGRILLDGIDLGSLSDDQRTRLRRARIGFVFQAFHLLPYLDVLANVALPLALLGVPRGERMQRATAMLDAVGLGGRDHAQPAELSGGEMQRVAVARALVHRPRLLLADEPTGNLDPDTAARVLSLLAEQVRATGAAAILVTHSAAAARTADRTYILDRAGLRPTADSGD